MQKNYDAKETEKKWQKLWNEDNLFSFNENSQKQIYSIDTPPPFTSGTLHLGHIYNHVWIDLVARYKRMRGYEVYLPQGFDCHGLPTELKVEKELGVDRRNREKFLEECRKWTHKAIAQMKKQFDMIGYSTDWNFTYKTMDSEYKKLVQKTLLDFYNKGLLFRAKHPILWCPKCETALAKAEVGYVEKNGKLYYIELDIKDSTDKVIIATTRPEMMPSCVAVFVHPSDDRYKKFVGSKVVLPIYNRGVPLMEDKDVDMEFGTGVVYLCTYGDEQDISWQKNYKLPVIISLNSDGTLNDEAGKYSGLSSKEARKEIVKDLKSLGRIKKIEDLHHSVLSHTERESCRTPIEFLPYDQWFINVRDFIEDIIKVSKDMNWYPGYMLKRLTDWSESMDWDWIISRQRVFGTPIPFWICKDCSEVTPAIESELPVDPRGTKKVCKKCGSKNMVGETDVCDCWVDSSITPLIISKWNENENFFKKTYPATLRPQGYEIIRTWAFYTIFRNFILTKKGCFKDILINGMVAGGDGKKMSKSLGNVISPEEPIEKYSVDALRQWASLGSLGDDYPFSFEECSHSQAFLIKLWNISRFIEMHIKDYSEKNKIDESKLRPTDKWILSKLQVLVKESTKNMEKYVFNIPLEKTRSFIWHDLADNYLEMIKHRLYKPDVYGKESRIIAQYTLHKTLKTLLKLLAPFTPHICEEIWENLFSKDSEKNFIATENWPQVEKKFIYTESLELGEFIKDIISEIRKFKSNKGIPLGKELLEVEIIVSKKFEDKIEIIKEDISGTGRIKNLVIIVGTKKDFGKEGDKNFEIIIKKNIV